MCKHSKMILKNDLTTGFKNIGIKSGDVLIVHASLSSLCYVCGGAQVVIEALMETVGTSGTIVMPTQSWKNMDPETGVHWEVSESCWESIRENWPAYDARITPSNNMGIIAETFRTWQGVIRSSHPARSFCAWGRYAEHIVKDHDLENIFGNDSPLHRIYNLNGYVLLLGVDFDKCTSLYLAESLAKCSKRYVTEHSAVMKNGKREWISYSTLDVDDSDFLELRDDFENEAHVKMGTIGDAPIKYFNQKELVDYAIKWFERNRE